MPEDSRNAIEQTEVLNEDPDDNPREGPHLVIFSGGLSSMVPLADGQSYVIGRSSAVDVPVDDNTMSRKHIEITCAAGVVTARDLGSSNGSRLNGQRLETPTTLAPGDILSVGATEIAFQAPRNRAGSVLPNREELSRALGHDIERAIHYGPNVTLALLSAGSSSTDLVAQLSARVRGTDRLGIVSDDVVGVLLLDVDAHGRQDAHARLSRELPDLRTGMATWPDDASDVEALFDAAEQALAEAKPGKLCVARDTVLRVPIDDEHEAVFADPAVSKVVALLERIAPTDLPVLIVGETGVGKELFARAVHARSSVSSGPFIAINCAALPETLAERELFGHAKGAFTGADEPSEGQFRAAHGGTIFFDEIAEMSLNVQAKLLRVLEDKRVSPLGDTTPHPVDVRLVAATNRDLQSEVEAGRFRRDLFYRIKGARLQVPPLRRRPRDVPLLARELAVRAAARMGFDRAELTPQVLYLLSHHPWPGNVRELRNVIELAVATAAGETVQTWMLPEELGGGGGLEDDNTPRFRPIAEQIAELEKLEITRALEATGGVRTRAAALLSMPLRTFHTKVKQYGLAGRYPRGGK